MAASIFFLLLSTIFTLRIAGIKTDVELIFKLMQKDNMDKVFQALGSLKRSFLELAEYGVNEEKKYKRVVEAYVKSRKNI